MQTHEGYVALFHLLMLVLTLHCCGSLDAVPRYQGQGLREYTRLLWKLWKKIEPANIRTFRGIVISCGSGVASVARGVCFSLWLAYSIVYFACDAVAATLDAMLWVAYVYAAVTWLMITHPMVWAIKTLLSATLATAEAAFWAGYVLLVVVWLLFKSTMTTFAGAVASLDTILLRFPTTVVVVTRFVAESAAHSLLNTAASLLVVLGAHTSSSFRIIASSVAITPQHATRFLLISAQAFISHSLVLLKNLRVVYWERGHQKNLKGSACSFTCVVLVPTHDGESSALRQGVEAVWETKTTIAEMIEQGSKPTSGAVMWDFRAEARIVWICEVLPATRLASTGTLSQLLALASTSLPVHGPIRASIPLSITAGEVRGNMSMTLPPIVALMLNTARSGFSWVHVWTQVADLCIEAKNEDQEEEFLVTKQANPLVDNGKNKHGRDNTATKTLLQKESQLTVEQLPRLQIERLEPEQPQQEQAQPSRLRAPTVFVPYLRKAQRGTTKPLQFIIGGLKPAAASQKEFIDETLTAVVGANVNPSKPAGQGDDTLTCKLSRGRASQEDGACSEDDQGQEGASEQGYDEPPVIDHGYDYNRDADARYLEYFDSVAYQTRRREALDRIHNRT